MHVKKKKRVCVAWVDIFRVDADLFNTLQMGLCAHGMG